MNDNHKQIWETYVASWKSDSLAKKRILFAQSLDKACEYNDPLVKVKGWNELEKYMLDFHSQVPGGYFVTTHFLSHHHKSIATWEMKNADNTVLGDGISYGEYNKNGLLISVSGFFELPNQ
jgi:hypothetical protein